MSSVTQGERTINSRTRGEVSPEDLEYGRGRVESALRYVTDPVLFVRLKLTLFADAGLACPALAQANVDINGRIVRAQVARTTMREAIDELHDRLRSQVEHADRAWPARCKPQRPPVPSRPAWERNLLRRKIFGPFRSTIAEAAQDLEMLDYDFVLFAEAGSGVDTLLSRTEDGTGYHLAQVEFRKADITPGDVEYTFSTQPVPFLDVEQAADQLAMTGKHFVFFRDTTTDRGCVMYQRYDGNYGLISPA